MIFRSQKLSMEGEVRIMSEKKNGVGKNTVLCCVIFAVYAVLTFIGAANHELWFDEAQAWVIARDNTIGGIFHQIGYEGHPPLWYIILYIPSHLGLPCTVIPFISWFITALAGALIMFRAPFNIITRSAVLFSGGFLFLNSVMSRVYCLINLGIVLTALVYPRRKQHPILYGIIIALLANTHICMSGFIGIIGIFMLIDLFKGFRTNGVKQNVRELAGLAAAGAGVLTMVIPLLDSLSINSSTSSMGVSARVTAISFFESFTDISHSIIDYGIEFGGPLSEVIGAAEYILAGIMAVSFILMIIIMRHKTRPFFMLLFFWLFYTIVTEVFWVIISNRAVVFASTFFVILWIAEYEPENNASKAWSKIKFNTDIKIFRKILEFVKKLDGNFRSSYAVMITAVMLFSVPMGAYYLFSDYTRNFCPSEEAAEFIRENISAENSVLVTSGEGYAEITAYLPEYKFYSTQYGRFYTYFHHDVLAEEISYSQIYNDLKDYDELYFLFTSTSIDHDSGGRENIYVIRDGLPYAIRYVEIFEYHLPEEYAEIS